MSKLHIAKYLIIFSLIFIRVDFSVLSMLRFYKKYPEKLYLLYPAHKRYMWSKAASNPQIQAIAVGVTGAVAWKALDVWDIQTQKEIANDDRVAENTRNEQTITAENKRHEQTIAAENKRHDEEMAMRNAELKKAQAALTDENRRHEEEINMRKKELETTNNT